MIRSSVRSITPLIGSIVVLLLVQVPAHAQQEARLQGIVVDEATRQPIGSATVTLVGEDLAVEVGWRGTFRLSGRSDGADLGSGGCLRASQLDSGGGGLAWDCRLSRVRGPGN